MFNRFSRLLAVAMAAILFFNLNLIFCFCLNLFSNVLLLWSLGLAITVFKDQFLYNLNSTLNIFSLAALEDKETLTLEI